MVIKMKLFFTFTKKGLAAVLFAAIVILLTAAWAVSLKLSVIDGSTHEKRLMYINSLGYEVNEKNIQSKEITIPYEFSDVYTKYNQLQKEAGFDLSDYRGKKATVYSYELWQENTVLHIIVYNGQIIGGDVAETAIDGDMLPLKKYGRQDA